MKRDGQYAPLIGVLMGSTSDWDVMQHACEVLKEFGVRFETGVVAAHRRRVHIAWAVLLVPDVPFFLENPQHRSNSRVTRGVW